MAEVIWTEPAIADLDAIADYIAIENFIAAQQLVQRVLNHAEQLIHHPNIGRYPPELGKQARYRELIEPPCRIFYRIHNAHLFIVHIMRAEQLLRKGRLRRAPPKTQGNPEQLPRDRCIGEKTEPGDLQPID